ncbi:hypothetical protein D9M70_453510 [compost metagenome]
MADGRFSLGCAGSGTQRSDAETQVIGSLGEQFNLLRAEGIGFRGVDADGAEDFTLDPERQRKH